MHSSAASSSSFSRDDLGSRGLDYALLDPGKNGTPPLIMSRDFQIAADRDDDGAMYTSAMGAAPFVYDHHQAAAAWHQHHLVNNSSFLEYDRSNRFQQDAVDDDNLDMVALFQQRLLLQQQIAEERARQRQQQQKLMIDAAFYAGQQHGDQFYGNPGAAGGFYSHHRANGGGGVRYSSLENPLARQVQQLAALRNFWCSSEQRYQEALQASGNLEGSPRSGAGSARNVCRFYLQGVCSRGENCPFLHTTARDQPSSLAASMAERSLSGRKAPSIKGLSNSFASMSLARRKVARDDETSSEKRSASTESQESDLSGEFRGLYDSTQQQQQKFTSLEEIEGRIYETAKDQHGCRFLQKKFSEGSLEEIDKIFAEVIDHLVDLMTDPFGNYLVQKLLEVSNDTQRREILRGVTRNGELVNISLNMHGTRAVQKLIETLKSPEQVSMVTSSLMQGVVTLIKDSNGNHVVQKCLQKLSNEDIQFIIDAAARHCVDIGTHRHGCCVLQRCIDFASGTQCHFLVSEIAANALILSQDQYGNYVVQYILDLEQSWITLDVIYRLEGNFALLAMQKFSSNVVEKCLKQSSEDSRALIIREIITSSLLSQLLQDPFANYVIQCALSVAKGSLHTALVDAIRPHVPVLRSSPFGKRILSRANINKR
ncbi:pumilio homolog 12 [Selaginella moellendorffii]|nr:pumilio homolog 12 [Selaginella moellendorffii]|eukprot:XP_002975751.2 pumilio homolog 12 [Selaginella moellendorffii]